MVDSAKSVVVKELQGDMTDLCSRAFADVGGLNIATAQALITDTFISDLLDEDHMAYAASAQPLIGKLAYNELSAILVPKARHDAIVTKVQDTHKKSYHAYHNECFVDQDWHYRSWAYGKYGVTLPGTSKMTRALLSGDGSANRGADPAVLQSHGSTVDGCTADAIANTAENFTTWNMSDDTILLGGAEYYVLVGIASAAESKPTEKSSIFDYYFDDLKKSF